MIFFKVKYFCIPCLGMQESPSTAGLKAKVIKPPPSEKPLKASVHRPCPTSPAPPAEKRKAKVEEPKEEEGTDDVTMTDMVHLGSSF